MKRLILLFSIIIFNVFSVTSQIERTADDYSYTQHYENGAIKILLHYNSQIFKSFYENGQVLATGKIDKSKNVPTEDKIDGDKLLAENYSKTGVWEYFHENGALNAKGTFIDNLEAGVWINYYSNGKVHFKGSFLKGIENGTWISYDDDGIIEEENNYDKLGELTGEQKAYYKNGQPSSTSNYVHGNMEGNNYLYFENGIVQTKYIYKNNELNGIMALFHKNGTLKYTVNYINNEEEGLAKYFYDNGNIESTGAYKNGLREGVWTYFTLNGGVKEKETYKKGKKI